MSSRAAALGAPGALGLGLAALDLAARGLAADLVGLVDAAVVEVREVVVAVEVRVAVLQAVRVAAGDVVRAVAGAPAEAPPEATLRLASLRPGAASISTPLTSQGVENSVTTASAHQSPRTCAARVGSIENEIAIQRKKPTTTTSHQ